LKWVIQAVAMLVCCVSTLFFTVIRTLNFYFYLLWGGVFDTATEVSE